MRLTITLIKDVTDESEAVSLYEVVKDWLVDKPDVKTNARVTSNLDIEPIPD